VRVLFNTYPVAFDCPGGGEIQLLRSREALQRAGITVDLFDPWRPQLDRADLVHYFSVQGGSMNFCHHVKQRGLPLLISPVLWLIEANLPRLPIQEIHDLLHLCDMVLPNSQAELEQQAEFFHLSRDRFCLTYNGIDETFTRRADPDLFRRHFGIHRPFVLNVANIEPRKNQRNLIRAVRGLGLDLVILGRPRDPDYLAACRSEGEGFLHLPGPVEHGSDLHKSACQACEVFALPSTLETPGLAALEAAALGARIVVTRTGSTQEYFADLVTYVDPEPADDIRRGIVAALAAPRTDLLACRVAREFTWDRTARQLLHAYNSVRHAGARACEEKLC
jgi:glycosyltransferase involved in cell wall biosynthesis